MKNTELQQSQTLPDNLFLTFLETAIKNAAEPIFTKLFEDSHRNQKKLEMGEEPIDIDEAALLIKKKKNTVYKNCSQNTIVFHKSGNKTLFYRSELEQILLVRKTISKGCSLTRYIAKFCHRSFAAYLLKANNLVFKEKLNDYS